MGYCTWAGMNEANRRYHDTEWGVPVHDDRQMFEHLTLECLQCGLSWDLMLKKREIFRQCFENFEYDKIAAYGDADVGRILNTEGMIRSPRKIRAVINNARCVQKLREERGSFSGENHPVPGARRRKSPGQQRPLRPDQQGFETARFQICGPGHDLFPPAGLRHHQRPRPGLPLRDED